MKNETYQRLAQITETLPDQADAFGLQAYQERQPRCKNCPFQQQGSQNQTRENVNNYQDVTCYNCNEVGHYSRNCDKPRRQQQNQRQNTTPQQVQFQLTRNQDSRNMNLVHREDMSESEEEDEEDKLYNYARELLAAEKCKNSESQ